MQERFYNIVARPDEPIVDSSVRKLGGSEFLTLGSRNDFPQYLYNLVKSVPTLRSLVEGSALISSSAFSSASSLMSKRSYTDLFNFLYIHGWCPLFIRQSFDKKSFFITPLDPRFVRMNEDRSKFAYSELPGFKNKKEYPAFSPDIDGSSILYLSINDLESPYALPLWSSALKSVDILSKVAEFHSNSMYNQFSASALINFNNGLPSAEDKAEIERLVNAKFAGAENASRIMISFNDSKDNAAEVQTLSSEDVSTRYHDLVDSCKSELFTSFRATSSLFGMPDGASNSLAAVDYKHQFELFKAFTLVPICDTIEDILSPFGVVFDESKLQSIISE